MPGDGKDLVCSCAWISGMGFNLQDNERLDSWAWWCYAELGWVIRIFPDVRFRDNFVSSLRKRGSWA